MPPSTGTGEQPVVWSRTRFRPDASARVPVQSPPHGTTSRRPGRRRAGFRYARRSESPITALADACGSSRASAAAAQDARSLLRQWRRRLPDAHRRRDVDYAVGDRRQHGRDGPAARSAPVLAYGAEHGPENPLRPEPCGARVGRRWRPRPGDARLEAGPRRRRHRRLLLRSARSLAARIQPEHQRAAALVLPQGHRPLHRHRSRARRRRRRTQHPAAQAPRLRQPDRAARRAAVAMTARIRRSPYGTPVLLLQRQSSEPAAIWLSPWTTRNHGAADRPRDRFGTKPAAPARRSAGITAGARDNVVRRKCGSSALARTSSR